MKQIKTILVVLSIALVLFVAMSSIAVAQPYPNIVPSCGVQQAQAHASDTASDLDEGHASENSVLKRCPQ